MDKQQLGKLESEYLPAFLTFAIKRVNCFNEAEELSQEIAYQCLLSIEKGNIIENFDGFVWSVAHNTYKRWCKRKKPLSFEDEFETFSNISNDDIPIDDALIVKERTNKIRLELSRMSKHYRETLVCFYYDELSIRTIAQKLIISEEMVKFYLRAGKQKLKEAYIMDIVGEKSLNPSDFTVYKSAIDFSKVNVWDVFKRKLPCQIALICHDSVKTISDISLETGTPAVYIEDEIELLLDAGVMINPVKDKYRTNLFILKKNTAAQIKEQFTRLYEAYVPDVIKSYEKYLTNLKECGVFLHNASDSQWQWCFANNIVDFDYESHLLSAEDYPQILSCGSKGFIFAEEAKGSPWGSGHTPTYLEKCVVWPCDVEIFGEYHFQKELRDEHKAQVLYDVYCGKINDDYAYIYAELIEQGYVVKENDKLYCNIAVSSEKSRNLFNKINAELMLTLKPLCGEIRENIARIVKSTIPEQLKPYTKGYTETWISFYSGAYLHEALYNKGFITIPEKDDKTPVASYIYER